MFSPGGTGGASSGHTYPVGRRPHTHLALSASDGLPPSLPPSLPPPSRFSFFWKNNFALTLIIRSPSLLTAPPPLHLSALSLCLPCTHARLPECGSAGDDSSVAHLILRPPIFGLPGNPVLLLSLRQSERARERKEGGCVWGGVRCRDITWRSFLLFFSPLHLYFSLSLLDQGRFISAARPSPSCFFLAA